MLTEHERGAILDAEILQFTAQGYRVTQRTLLTAQLVRPKTFSIVAAVAWLFVFFIGLLIYLLIYAAQADDAVYLTVQPDGTLDRQFSGGARRGQNDPSRWECHQCGYRNAPRRPLCKRCRQPADHQSDTPRPSNASAAR